MAFSLLPKDLNQWKVVLIAFAVATTFWFFNSLNKEYTTSLGHPIEFTYNTDSLVSVRNLPTKIDLDVTGGGWSLFRKEAIFRPEPIQISLDNPAGVRHINWIEVLPSIREQVGDLSVNRVLQDTLRVQIEPILSKKVRLWVDSTKLDLSPNFRLISDINLPNAEVTLTGPKSFIDTLSNDFELIITEEEIDEGFSESVEITVPHSDLITATPSEAQVTFSVDRFDRLQIEVPIQPFNFPSDSSTYLSEEKVIVNFTVQRLLQQEYTAEDFGVTADYQMMRESDSVVLALVVHSPVEASSVSISPDQIKVIHDK